MKCKRDIKICRGIDSSFQNWPKQFDKIWPKHLEVTKISILMGSKGKIVWAKKGTEELSFIKLKTDTKYGEKSTCLFKIDIGNILTWALESLKNFHFNGVLSSKVYIVWATKVQRGFLSWNWSRIQNL